jgi:hypothetical protein
MATDKRPLEIESLKKELCDRPDRRELLDKLGKIAAYTPPVMLGMMLSSRPTAASEGCGPEPLTPCDPT